PTWHDDRTNVLVLEHTELGVLEVLGKFRDLQVKAQVRLVASIQAHGVSKSDAVDWALELNSNELPNRLEELLSKRDDVILLNKTHLDVELGELRLAVRAEVLIAVATSDLVVTLHTGDHEQLLEQLR